MRASDSVNGVDKTTKGTYLANGFKVAPHLGLRYSSYKLDNLSVNSTFGEIATNKFDNLKVVSIPVGVNLSKDFTTGDWKLNAKADLGVTFNTGDKNLVSNTTFKGVLGSVDTDSKVFDKV